MSFRWWRIMEDGTAEPVDDTRAVSALVDRTPGGWYGNIEGAILHGGVQAVAVSRRTEMTYDSKAWLERDEMIPAGEITVTKITASPPA